MYWVIKELRRVSQSYLRRDGMTRRVNLPTYPEWLNWHISERKACYQVRGGGPRLSVLTTVYENTSEDLFLQTGASVLTQSYPNFEWVVLAHGPITAGLNDILNDLSSEIQVRVYRLSVNLGIMRGMRFCLERATGEYIVPLDADDLLTRDALQIVASVITKYGSPAYLYSDEDMLVDGMPTAPYWRPDWDPVLNLASSYIWHLCAFRRDLALELGVFQDGGSEWCHDWDTVFRFSNAGHIPLHIPEVLYHWRQHQSSSTNRPFPERGSLASQRHLLELQIARQPEQELYELDYFPIFRGSVEWYVRRRHRNGEPMDVLLIARNVMGARRTLRSIQLTTDYPFRSVIVCVPENLDVSERQDLEACGSFLCREEISDAMATRVHFVANPGLREVIAAVNSVTAPFVVLCSDAVEVEDGEWPWEALKLMELHQDVAIVGGRILDTHGTVVATGMVFREDGLLVCPEKHRTAGDPGHFALALKPHTVNGASLDFLVADREFLTSALNSLPVSATLACLPMWLGGAALKNGRRVAFSPLINAKVSGPLLAGDCSGLGGGKEREAFLREYGNSVKSCMWSSQRFVNYQKIYRPS
ncbi:MAG: glycosyltransferase [Candidatus Binatia bacterium]